MAALFFCLSFHQCNNAQRRPPNKPHFNRVTAIKEGDADTAAPERSRPILKNKLHIKLQHKN